MSHIDKLFGPMRVAATGLSAERTRMDVIARNIANAQTTSVPGRDGPYQRQVVDFAPLVQRIAPGQSEVMGVQVSDVRGDSTTPYEEVFDPGHPDANADGIVLMPNVNTVKEMADLITAVRAYEANLEVQTNFQQMAERSLRLAE